MGFGVHFCRGAGMKISETINIMSFLLEHYGDLDIYKIQGHKYKEIDQIIFIGGQRCVLMNRHEDKEKYKTIQHIDKYFNKKDKIKWLQDCEGEENVYSNKI